MEASYAQLTDFDWSMRLVLSSDKLSGLRKPILLLKLDIASPDGTTEEKLIELNTEDAGELLNKLKGAQAAVQRFS